MADGGSITTTKHKIKSNGGSINTGSGRGSTRDIGKYGVGSLSIGLRVL